MSEKLVFSTAGSSQQKKQKGKSKKPAAKAWVASSGPTKMRLETKGRGGKSVTVLFNLPLSEIEAKELMRQLQASLACGATLKNGCIELRGDLRDKIEAFFKAQGQKLVRAGG